MKQQTLQEYYSTLTPQAKKALNHIRAHIKKIIPEAEERISYGMPTFFLGKAVVGYAAFKEHYSVFPYSSSVLRNFTKELSGYATSKGTIRIPYGEFLSAQLIKKIITVRITENAEREILKAQKKKEKRPNAELPDGLAAPAQRALAIAGIKDLKQLSRRSESDIAELHGIGKNALVTLRAALASQGSSFAKTTKK